MITFRAKLSYLSPNGLKKIITHQELLNEKNKTPIARLSAVNVMKLFGFGLSLLRQSIEDFKKAKNEGYLDDSGWIEIGDDGFAKCVSNRELEADTSNKIQQTDLYFTKAYQLGIERKKIIKARKKNWTLEKLIKKEKK